MKECVDLVVADKEKEQKSIFRWVGWLLLLGYGLMVLFSTTSALPLVSPYVQGNEGYIMGFASLLMTLPLLFWRGKVLFTEECPRVYEKMNIRLFFNWLWILLFLNMVTSLVWQFVAEFVANQFGYTVLPSAEIFKNLPRTFNMLLYACLIGPVLEEVLYRGLLMNSLARVGGRYFGLICSTVLFGFMHGNVVQTPSTWMMGAIFGIVAMRYSLGAATLLHIVNNFLAMMVLRHAEAGEPLGVASALFIMTSLVLGPYLMWRYRQEIREILGKLEWPGTLVRKFIVSVPIALFLIISIALMILGIDKLPV